MQALLPHDSMRHALLIALALVLAPLVAAQDPLAGLPDIPYQTFTLDNGLTLIVHEDRKAPIVAVNVWYHVGSKNEPDGRSGFAHLFEHLMFNGSENFNDDYFQVLERVGATDLNGTTNTDRTNYFQNVPVGALDAVLFMESDRMGHLLGAVDQAKLDEQRGVVQNEKRQGENNPYGMTRQLVNDATYPQGHPYDHTVIGSMDDLNAASLEDVQEWFKTYYGPNNAVVVIAGDVTPEVALEKVTRYFGDIEPGPPVASFERWVAAMDGDRRQVTEDRVPQARIHKVWNVPEVGDDGLRPADRRHRRARRRQDVAALRAAGLPRPDRDGRVRLRPERRDRQPAQRDRDGPARRRRRGRRGGAGRRARAVLARRAHGGRAGARPDRHPGRLRARR